MSHLIVVDVQNERRTPGSDYNLGDLSSLVSKINTLIDHCRTHGYKIIFVRHVEKDSDEVFGEHHHR
ncbi:isochorismatase family protein [Patescibacteria group bacterium]|nr:isochorismatase family protein [Patescibacteria group bacterium]